MEVINYNARRVDLLTQLKIAYNLKRDYDLKLSFTQWLEILDLKHNYYRFDDNDNEIKEIYNLNGANKQNRIGLLPF
jgi:hypothetical protein